MGRLNSTMQMIVVMQALGWTYEQYMKTPQYVLTAIMEKMKRDKKAEELEAKKHNYGR